MADQYDIAPVIAAMTTLGEAWRGDWSNFDGRTLRSQLDELADIFRAAANGEDVRRSIAGFYAGWRICERCCTWNEYCMCKGKS